MRSALQGDRQGHPQRYQYPLYYGKGQFILNWENEPDQVRCHDFVTGIPTPIASKALKAGKEYSVVIDIDPKHLTLTISGKRIYSVSGDFTALKSPLGIGLPWGPKFAYFRLSWRSSRDG